MREAQRKKVRWKERARKLQDKISCTYKKGIEHNLMSVNNSILQARAMHIIQPIYMKSMKSTRATSTLSQTHQRSYNDTVYICQIPPIMNFVSFLQVSPSVPHPPTPPPRPL